MGSFMIQHCHLLELVGMGDKIRTDSEDQLMVDILEINAGNQNEMLGRGSVIILVKGS